jgi:hypothetical protein
MGKPQSTGNLVNALAQDSSNNIGIGGAANASFKLQVTGATNLTGALSGTSASFSSGVTFGANNRGFIREPAGDVEIGGASGAALKLYSNGVEYAKIAPSTGFTTTLPFGGTTAIFSSNVGINGSPGTAFPLEAYINSSTAYTTSSRGNVMRVYNSNSGSNVFAGIELGAAGPSNDGLAGLNAVVTSAGSAALTFYTRDSNTFAEKMRITSGGQIGVGISPTAWDTTYFRVQELGNSNSRAFVYGRTDTAIEAGIGANAYYSSAGWKYINTGGASTILFGGNEMLFRITDSGTADNSLTWNTAMKLTGGKFAFGNSTDWRFNIESSAGGYLLNSHNTRNQSGDVNALFQLGNNANNTSSYFLVCSMPSGDKMYILGNGNVQNINNSYGALSDIKLKENIVDATPKLEKLLKVKIRNYNIIGEQTKQIGVIAQELEQVFPSMIEEAEDFENIEVIDEDGNTTKQRQSLGTTTKSVKYSVFVPMLIKAIQEQTQIIKDLEARIKQLENK